MDKQEIEKKIISANNGAKVLAVFSIIGAIGTMALNGPVSYAFASFTIVVCIGTIALSFYMWHLEQLRGDE